MSAEFLDSNIFVYLFDASVTNRHTLSRAVVTDAIKSARGVISFQVVQEVLNVITTKMPTPVSIEDAREFFDTVLKPMWRVYPNSNLYHRALNIRSRYRYSFYDSLIIAAALGSGCSELISEDLQAGQTIDGLTIINPFN